MVMDKATNWVCVCEMQIGDANTGPEAHSASLLRSPTQLLYFSECRMTMGKPSLMLSEDNYITANEKLEHNG